MSVEQSGHHAVRRFGLGDGLILVIALGIAFERFRAQGWLPQDALWCWQAFAQLTGLSPWMWGGLTRQQVMTELEGRSIALFLELFCPVLLGLMFAQPLVRLRSPRPPWRQIIRQPGFVACLLGILVVAIVLPMGPSWFSLVALSLWSTRILIGLMIWPLSTLKPWQAEASWVDRLGRAVGFGWVVTLVAGTVLLAMGWD